MSRKPALSELPSRGILGLFASHADLTMYVPGLHGWVSYIVPALTVPEAGRVWTPENRATPGARHKEQDTGSAFEGTPDNQVIITPSGAGT